MTVETPDLPVRSMRDIVNALARHPEWRSALRTHLLGEELIELPTLFAKFATETTRRLDLLTAEMADLKTDVAGLRHDVGGLKHDVGGLRHDVGSLTKTVGKLTNDVGELKGAHAEALATKNIELIADELDLEYQRTIRKVERRRLARNHGADVASDEIKSFVATDIIAEATDADGNTVYLAVEASYTADRDDTRRARRHAQLMHEFTGAPCRAVIASVRNSDQTRALIEQGEIRWHQLHVRIQPAA